ncbi:MAG: ThuA domain-containing protein [Maioricimonas sp. JB045]
MKHALAAAFLLVLSATIAAAQQAGPPLELTLRYQTETGEGTGRYHQLTRKETWQPEKTALIVCDVWDLHHCLNAVRRVEEFAPRLNRVVEEARKRGVTIIHAPSDCMEAYADHPARERAMAVPKAAQLPQDIDKWCSRIPAEEQAVYPIDQSDGGEDDDPAEHAEWAKKLADMGRNPNAPWKKQSDLIAIDAEQDFISDRGDEVWSILESRGIENVILTGVHTNMCVLGRPFGLRQMARNGKNVVLMRDMTDTMYNPERWPYVSHFTGTDLIVSHIEKFVAPTITSAQLIGGSSFVFAKDKRPHLVIVMAEAEYRTNETLPEFARKYLGKDFRVSLVHANEEDRNDIPGIDVVKDADVLLVSVRRRTLPPEQLQVIRDHVAAGKPVVGIRTASHAFNLRNQPAPEGLADWPEWDAEVFGGNYHNHYGNALKSTVRLNQEQLDHPILTGIPNREFPQGWSLYRTSPLKKGTTPLVFGRIEDKPEEPAAWTFKRADGGRSFYTSLGNVDDFKHPSFIRLLVNGIYWASGMQPPEEITVAGTVEDYRRHWMPLQVPGTWADGSGDVLTGNEGPAWYRCMVRIPETFAGHAAQLAFGLRPGRYEIWINGEVVSRPVIRGGSSGVSLVTTGNSDVAGLFDVGEVNLIAVRCLDGGGIAAWPEEPTPRITFHGGPHAGTMPLAGTWQFRLGNDPSWGTLPLPPKFAVSTDSLFEASTN